MEAPAAQQQAAPPPELALPLPGGRRAEVRVTDRADEGRGAGEPVLVGLTYDSPALGRSTSSSSSSPAAPACRSRSGDGRGARGAGAAARRRSCARALGRRRGCRRRCGSSAGRRSRESTSMPDERPRRATALRYAEGSERARGRRRRARGEIAKQILEAAEDAGVPVRQDPALVEALSGSTSGGDPARALRRGRRGARLGLPARREGLARPVSEVGGYATSRKSASSSARALRSERLSWAWIWQTRLSETPRISPISRRVRFLT